MFKKLFIIGVLGLLVMPTMSKTVFLSGHGQYRLSEFDSLNSGTALAEQLAIEDIASKIRKKVLSIKSIDKNGYYTQARWLINSAIISKRDVTSSVQQCKNGVGLCANVTLTAGVDTALAEGHLKLLYSDIKLSNKINRVIEDDKERERLLLLGKTIDFAVARNAQEKRKKILDYIAGELITVTATSISPEVFQKIKKDSHLLQTKELKENGLLLEYQQLLVALKNNLVIDVVTQRGSAYNDGSAFVSFNVQVSSERLVESLTWVAKKLGVPDGDWDAYRDHQRSRHLSLQWFYPLERMPNGLGGRKKQAAVILGEIIDRGKAIYVIQYGADSFHGQDYHGNGADYDLQSKKVRLVEKLASYSLCIEFSLESSKEVVEQCIIGGKEAGKTNHSYTPSWDKSSPFMWIVKNHSHLNFDFPLNIETMGNQNLKYKVVIKKGEYKTNLLL